jgi:hypothetical protein
LPTFGRPTTQTKGLSINSPPSS